MLIALMTLCEYISAIPVNCMVLKQSLGLHNKYCGNGAKYKCGQINASCTLTLFRTEIQSCDKTR